MSKLSLLVVTIIIGGGAVHLIIQAGPLEPPVPPDTPTMLPIDEVDPRRPIVRDMLPLVITEETSSWYLAQTIHDNSLSGPVIDVQAIGVTIDLRGFTLWTGSGPTIVSNYEGTTVQNGLIVSGGKGVDLSASAIVRNLAVTAGGNGIEVGAHSMVVDSRSRNSSGHGIIAEAGSIVRGCVSNENGENGIWLQGAIGEYGGIVADSVVLDNGKNGIRIDGDAFVLNNECRGNDSDDSEGKAGIWVAGDRARVENNHVSMNDVGIDIDGSNNVVVNNSVVDNVSLSIDIAPGAVNNIVPIYTAGSAGTPGVWVNFCLGPGCI
jgi:parallel beta-helix repeat protein